MSVCKSKISNADFHIDVDKSDIDSSGGYIGMPQDALKEVKAPGKVAVFYKAWYPKESLFGEKTQ